MRVPRLMILRRRAFLTQRELAQRAGLSEVTVNRLEQGKQTARISTIRKLASALGVVPEELV